MDIEVPCKKIGIKPDFSDAQNIVFSDDQGILTIHTDTSINVYKMPEMELLDKFKKNVFKENFNQTLYNYYSYKPQTNIFYALNNTVIFNDYYTITIIINGMKKVFHDKVITSVLHRDHLYYFISSQDGIETILKCIQVNNIEINDVKAEVLKTNFPLRLLMLRKFESDEKNNRLFIHGYSELTILNLDIMGIEYEIGYICDFTQKHALTFDKNTGMLQIYDLFSRSNHVIPFTEFSSTRWPQITDRYVIMPLESSLRIYTHSGDLCMEIDEEEIFQYNTHYIAMYDDNMIGIYRNCMCRYDISRFNKEKQKTTFLCGGISEDSSVYLFMQNYLYDRHLLPLITELV